MNALEARGLIVAYGGRRVLDLERLDIAPREFFVLLGPSGGGKTTLLRVIAGLVRPNSGSLGLFGQDALPLPPHRRGVAMVFQGLALWPHLSVRGNIALGLAREVPDGAERARRIEEAAGELAIERFLGSRPGLLSGGERQRVALARALVRRPRLLLLDEPFSDLDARLRRATARLVRDLHDRHEMTTMLITHDRTDAHLLADRIGVMREGRLIACGVADALHREPGSRFAMEFLTDAAILRGPVREGHVITSVGPLPLATPGSGPEAIVAVRPDEVTLGSGRARGRVIACEFAGGPWRCRIAVGGDEVAALHAHPLRAGEEVVLEVAPVPRPALKEDA